MKNVLGIAMLLVGVAAVEAAPVGTLTTGICANGGVTVTANSIDWLLPAGGGNGCIQTGTTTNVTYTGGGPLLGGVLGTILDLTVATPFPVVDFMTFAGNPNLHFDLTLLGPGRTGANATVCATVLDPNQPSCSVFAGSPFILAPTRTGTSVTLSASGIARDASGVSSTWEGAFTTQIASTTPAQIQTTINGGGSVTSTHSGEFRVSLNPIPEPGTYAMLLSGGLLVGLSALRRRNKA